MIRKIAVSVKKTEAPMKNATSGDFVRMSAVIAQPTEAAIAAVLFLIDYTFLLPGMFFRGRRARPHIHLRLYFPGLITSPLL